MDRRQFLKLTGLAALIGLIRPALPALTTSEGGRLVPTNLHKSVRRLYEERLLMRAAPIRLGKPGRFANMTFISTRPTYFGPWLHYSDQLRVSHPDRVAELTGPIDLSELDQIDEQWTAETF